MKRKVTRLLVAASGLGHVARGIETWAHDLGHALAARGVAVTLCKGGGQANAPFERVIPCCQRESPAARRLLRILPRRGAWRLGLGSGYDIEQTTFALNLLIHLRRERVQILHVQDPHLARLVQCARRLGIVRTRTILAHGTEEPPEFLRPGITYLQHLAPWHLEECRRAGAWRSTWTAIPNFIDTDRFQPGRADDLRGELGIPADGLVVLSAAAIKRGHKRIDYLLDEFAELRRHRPDLPVWLIVAGGWEADTDQLVEDGRRRLGDQVRFLVRFPRERMADLYRAADVFTLCSLKEMMPIALLEAIASGLPCVTNNHPVMAWMTGPGGMTPDLSVKGSLAGALETLVTSSERRQALGRAARQHCLANFRQDVVVDQILEYYRIVMDRERQPRRLDLTTAQSGSH